MLCYWPMSDPHDWENLPQDVKNYIRYLRRYIINLEQTPPQQKIEELQGVIQRLQVDLEDAQATIAQQQQIIQTLQQQLAHVQTQLNQNSSNSSLPPSSDRFHVKRRPPQPPSGKSRGGQPHHPRGSRPLVPPERVTQIIPCLPTSCRRCGHELTGTDPNPLRYQVVELPPPVQPEVTEYQQHRLTCPCCQTTTCGALPAHVRGHTGPRLQATLAVLAAGYRQSVRSVQALASQLWSLELSTGLISKLRQQTAEALQQPYAEVSQYVKNQNVNIDETGWREGKKKGYLWMAVATGATVFKIALSRGHQVAQAILGLTYNRVATCDRLKSYWWIERLQWCWAHLRRDFQAMIDRQNAGSPVGKKLLSLSDELFHDWHLYKKGKQSRRWLVQRMEGLRQRVHRALQRGKACGCAKTAGTCRELLGHESWLWTFAEVAGVEPTNNTGERAGRQAVMWRKVGGRSDGPRGSRFIERMLTVVHTCKQRGKEVLSYVESCCRAWQEHQPVPALIKDTS